MKSLSFIDVPRSNQNHYSKGLTLENFRQIGVRGVTDARNSYSQAMAYFKNKLYIGTSRDTLCLLLRPTRTLTPPKMEFWPVKCVNTNFSELWRGQIISYDPFGEKWQKVYESPMITFNGERAMRDVGYRCMTIHQGPNDSTPCLYIGTMSIPRGFILRSEDGMNFEKIASELGTSTTIRTLISYKGKLYASTVGRAGHQPNESNDPVVFESEDPGSGKWREVSYPGFGDPCNTAVFEMVQFSGFLYAATMNPTGGFQLWKTDAEGKPPYIWTKVITAGAYRGYLNEYGISLVEHEGRLCVGTGISGGGYDQVYRIGPAPSELIYVYPDDTWDLVVGAPRITPEGTKIPISGMGPGFNNFLNGYTWRMCVHEGWLYIGTFNSAAFLPYKPYGFETSGSKLKALEKLLPTGSLDKFIADYGGCHLWRTKDGEQFYPITRNGFGTPYNIGVRQMVSTPFGLFVGTVNPFGPLVGVKRNGKWGYEFNPRGGTEIWLGSSQFKKQNRTESVPQSIHTHSSSRDRKFRHSLLKLGHQYEQLFYFYLLEDYYESSGFHHIGYWTEKTTSVKQACQDLMDKLMSFLPDKKGPVLDVACGKGGTTYYLSKYFRSEDIIGIDESQWAIDFASKRAPQSQFLVMNPTRTDFPNESFDSVICVEGCPYLDTRYKFLMEAARILRPSGTLVLADILFSKDTPELNYIIYRANYVKDIGLYTKLLIRAGFKKIELINLTENCIRLYVNNLSDFMKAKYYAKEISEGKFNAVMAFITRMILLARHYIIIAATKN